MRINIKASILLFQCKIYWLKPNNKKTVLITNKYTDELIDHYRHIFIISMKCVFFTTKSIQNKFCAVEKSRSVLKNCSTQMTGVNRKRIVQIALKLVQ